MYRLRLLTMMFFFLSAVSSFAQYAHWELDGTLASSTGHPPLVPMHIEQSLQFDESIAPQFQFVTDEIEGTTTTVLSFAPKTYFELYHDFQSINGIRGINNYTIIMDVKIENPNGGRISLLTGSYMNIEFISMWKLGKYGELGNRDFGYGFIDDRYQVYDEKLIRTGLFQYNRWQRIALVYQGDIGTAFFYCNGELDSIEDHYHREYSEFFLFNPIYIFADSNEYSGGYISNIQVRREVLSADEIRKLGRPTAAGIPQPNVPSFDPQSVQIPSTIQTGTQTSIQWQVSQPQGFLQIDLYDQDTFIQTIGYAQMNQTQFNWTPSVYLPNSDNYQIVLTWMQNESVRVISQPFAIQNRYEPLNPIYAKNLVKNPKFESGLTDWTIESGTVSIDQESKTDSPFPIPLESNHRLSISHTGFTHISQTIDLYAEGIRPNEIAKGLNYRLDSIIGNPWIPFRTDIQLQFFDVSRQLIQTVLFGDGLIPFHSRYIQLSILADLYSEVNFPVDNIWFSIYPSKHKTNPARLVTKPRLHFIPPNGMKISFDMDGINRNTAMYWGIDGEIQTKQKVCTISKSDYQYNHCFEQNDLQPGKRYSYQIESGNETSPEYSFTMPDVKQNKQTIAWFANNQLYVERFLKISKHMIDHHDSDFIFSAGGISDWPADPDNWNQYLFEPLSYRTFLQKTPIFSAYGNNLTQGLYFFDLYLPYPNQKPFYAFTLGSTRFIFLYSGLKTDTSLKGVNVQDQWLQEELQSADYQAAKFHVVTFFVPPFSDFWHDPGFDGNPEIRKDWVPLFEQYKVDLVINGYVDYYLRGDRNGVRYIVIGGGGGNIDTPYDGGTGSKNADWGFWDKTIPKHHYAIMKLDQNKLNWTAYDIEGNVMDEFVMGN